VEELSKGASIDKESVAGLLGAGKGLFRAAQAGWKGKGIAGKAGLSGVKGAKEHGKAYMTALSKKSPGTAMGLTAAGAAVPAYAAGQAMG
jgi:hypothetical protein